VISNLEAVVLDDTSTNKLNLPMNCSVVYARSTSIKLIIEIIAHHTVHSKL